MQHVAGDNGHSSSVSLNATQTPARHLNHSDSRWPSTIDPQTAV